MGLYLQFSLPWCASSKTCCWSVRWTSSSSYSSPPPEREVVLPTKYKAGNDVAVTSDDDDHDAGDKIEWDLLLNPSEQLCQVDPSIRWKSCESSSVICSATWQVNFLLIAHFVILFWLMDCVTPPRRTWSWANCDIEDLDSSCQTCESGINLGNEKDAGSCIRRSSYLRMNWNLTECCFYLSQNSQLLTRQTSKPGPILSFHAWSSWWWTQSTSREGFCSRSPPV